jgi:peroxiredoxin
MSPSSARSWAALAAAIAFLPGAAAGLEIGEVVPDFTMATLDGGRFSLAEAERTHRAVVVLFVSTICPYSNYYDDLVRDMSGELEKKGVIFAAVNSGTVETAEEVRAHARSHGHTFPIIKDPHARVADLLGASRTPEAFLLDSSGALRYHGRVASKLSSPDLKKAIEALLAGKPIRPAETRAFGCAITRD